MTFAGKSRYDRIFRQVIHKGEEYAMNYIKILQNAQAFSITVVKNYSEDQSMAKFWINFAKVEIFC